MNAIPISELKKPFVGRTSELQQLRDSLELVMGNKQPKFVMIQGDFGVGKTALIEHFLTESLERNSTLLLGRAGCQRETENNGLVPFSQLLVRLLKTSIQQEVVVGSPSEFINEIAPAWSDILGDEIAEKDFAATVKNSEYGADNSNHTPDNVAGWNRSGGVNVTAESIQVSGDVVGRDKIVANIVNIYTGSRQPGSGKTYTPDQVFEQYSNALRKLSADLPVIAFIDDLHWIDTSSLNLLAHLDRFLRDRAVLFICVYRPVEALETGPNAQLFRDVLAELRHKVAVEISHGIDVAEYVRQRYARNLFSRESDRSRSGHY